MYYPPQPIWVTKYTSTAVSEVSAASTSVVYSSATQQISVQSNGNAVQNISLFNALGEQVYQASFSGQLTIKTNSLKSGVYFYQLSNQNNNVSTGKIIVY